MVGNLLTLFLNFSKSLSKYITIRQKRECVRIKLRTAFQSSPVKRAYAFYSLKISVQLRPPSCGGEFWSGKRGSCNLSCHSFFFIRSDNTYFPQVGFLFSGGLLLRETPSLNEVLGGLFNSLLFAPLDIPVLLTEDIDIAVALQARSGRYQVSNNHVLL